MRTVLLASLRSHTRRYVAALLAVVIGVSFIIMTAALSSAIRDGLTSGLGAPYAGADAVVDLPTADDAARLIEAAPQQDAQAWLIGWTIQPVAHGGDLVDSTADVGHLPDAPDRRWQELEDGRFPGAPGEAVADVHDAGAAGIEVGDRIRVGSGGSALEVTVVGLVDSPSTYATASVYLLWDDLARWQDSLYVGSVAWAGAGDHDAAAATITDLLPGVEVLEVDTFLQEMAASINNGVDVISTVVLLFSAIALVVAVLVINNTFTILFAQRARDFALLRCVGATRRQVLGSIRAESLAVGLLAAALGLLVGLGAGHGLVALVRAQWPAARLGEAEVGIGWLVAGGAVAVAVTLVAAWLPTRRAVRVAPLAALRPDDSTRAATRPGVLRIGAGALLLAGGTAALGVAIAGSSVPAMVAGGTLAFLGVLAVGPVLVPALIRAAGPLSGRLLGPAGRLAAGNAVRNPRRTAATAASLLIGVTLTTAVLTGMASARGAIAAEMDRQHPVDVAITGDAALGADVVRRIGAAPDVADTLEVAGATADLAGLGDYPVLAAPAVDDAAVRDVVRGDRPPAPGDGRILLPWSALGDGIDTGDRLRVTVGARTVTLRVAGGEGWGEAALVSAATLDRLAPDAAAQAVWVRAEDGTDADELAGALEAIARPADAELENGLSRRDYVDLQLDVLTGGVVGLLGIAVVIALVGIGNTLGLSVLERGREHALLRALGLTRRGLRALLAAEAVLLSLVATLLGTALGVTFAWVGVHTMVRPAVAGASIVLPWWQLAAVVGVSGVAGLLAAVLPARRAARVTPAAGLALE